MYALTMNQYDAVSTQQQLRYHLKQSALALASEMPTGRDLMMLPIDILHQL
jgi:hypothetical protein